MKRGLPLPKWFLDEPAIDEAERIYIDGFLELQTCRSIGMDLGPIPWRDVVAYADRLGLDSDMVRVFCKVIRALDAAFLEWNASKTEVVRSDATRPAET